MSLIITARCPFLPSVVEDTKGKVYGFVRFNSQNDQREALIHMNGFAGLNGNKRPIKVRSDNVPEQGCTKRTFPCCVKLGEKVAFCLPTEGRKAQSFYLIFKKTWKGSFSAAVYKDHTIREDFCQVVMQWDGTLRFGLGRRPEIERVK